jgi:hypothetical protein
MANIQTRTSALAIIKETTENTLKKPSAGTDFVALQDDFSLEPNFTSLDNAELKASLAPSKKILGTGAATASMSHYLRHSGTEGVAPGYGELLEALLGTVVTASTEYNTVASSTTSLLKVDTGEGAQFQRGQLALIKDPTNGYRIRAIDSIYTDDLTMGFQLPNAPGTGVNLGKCVLYKPLDTTAHPTLSLWHYLGNGGALKAGSGMRVVSGSFDVTAGELINANYSLEGAGFYFNPIEIATGANAVVFDIGGSNLTATLTVGFYKTPIEAADALAAAMTAQAGVAITVTYSSSTGKFTVSKATGSLAIDWATGTNTAGASFGFTADDTGALTYESDSAISLGAAYTPSYDSSDPLVAKENEVMLGLASEYVCFKASTFNVSINTPKGDKPSICATSGIDGSVITARETTITVSALLEQYDAKQFERLRQNTEIKFQFSFGSKSAGNWIAGKSGAIYSPTCSITSFTTEDADGLVQVNLELAAFANSSGQGEIYIGFV